MVIELGQLRVEKSSKHLKQDLHSITQRVCCVVEQSEEMEVNPGRARPDDCNGVK